MLAGESVNKEVSAGGREGKGGHKLVPQNVRLFY